jgi:microsomal dipeptidase-like Zn-dependent dipeptidase
MESPTELESLSEALRDAGWPVNDVQGFAYNNWRRFLSSLLK